MSRPTSGSFYVDGIDTWRDEAVLARQRNLSIGFVFQFFNLLPEFTAAENVMIPAVIAGCSRKESALRAQKLISEVNLSARAEHLPSELSGGEQQRIAIARALVNRPKIFIADEPTGNLDKKTGREIMDVMLKLQADYGFTLLIATHNEDIASRCKRVVTIVDGQLV
jgi:predicted ABC-type transport system involved in lysophospholipase L1 biosynthesis ATPase subunit